MPLVAVTRLRVRAWRYVPAFFIQALRSARQARRANGNVRTSLLAEARRTFWTLTVWSDEAAMRAFMTQEPHGRVMPHLKEWCDEAAIAQWTQEAGDLPSWADAHRRLQAEGRRSKVLHPSPAHEAFAIPPPAVRG
jgi:hypothetical protein